MSVLENIHFMYVVSVSLRKIENPRILLLDCPLEFKKGESMVSAICPSDRSFLFVPVFHSIKMSLTMGVIA